MTKKMMTFLASVTAAATFARAEPQTLLEISHAQWPAATLSNAVLVIVDAQREYGEGKLPLVGIADAVHQISLLLERARQAHTPVIHVIQNNQPPKPLFTAGTRMAEEFSELIPHDGEFVLPKTLPNSFANTELEGVLKKLGRRDLIIVGFMTHMCVSATARSALDHGYRCTLVASGCATRDLPDGAGGVVSAAIVHRTELAALRDRFATVVTDQGDIGL